MDTINIKQINGLHKLKTNKNFMKTNQYLIIRFD